MAGVPLCTFRTFVFGRPKVWPCLASNQDCPNCRSNVFSVQRALSVRARDDQRALVLRTSRLDEVLVGRSLASACVRVVACMGLTCVKPRLDELSVERFGREPLLLVLLKLNGLLPHDLSAQHCEEVAPDVVTRGYSTRTCLAPHV